MDKNISLKEKMIAKWNNNKTLDEVDVIVEDNETIDIINTKILTNMNRNNLVYISPIFGDIEPKAIVEYMQKHDLFDSKTPIRCQIQLHKVLWPVDQRGV